jgi:hypothetical protein
MAEVRNVMHHARVKASGIPILMGLVGMEVAMLAALYGVIPTLEPLWRQIGLSSLCVCELFGLEVWGGKVYESWEDAS